MPLCLTLMAAVASYSAVGHVMNCECDSFTSTAPFMFLPLNRWCMACRKYYQAFQENFCMPRFTRRHVYKCRRIPRSEVHRNEIFINPNWCYSCDYRMHEFLGERFYSEYPGRIHLDLSRVFESVAIYPRVFRL